MKNKIAAMSAIVLASVILAGCNDSKNQGQTEAGTTAVTAQTTAENTHADSTSESDSVAETSAVQSSTEIQTAEAEQTEATTETEEPVDVNAAELLAKIDNRVLGLPVEDKVYVFSNTDSVRENDDGIKLYGASCYDEHEGTLYYMCDFYVDATGTTAYRYYPESDYLGPCVEKAAFQKLNPATQSPQEIFRNAELMYGMFTLGVSPQLDSTDSFEENGRRYEAIADTRLSTWAELLNSLNSYFSEDIINSLMESNTYIREADGKLYYDAVSSGISPSYISSEYELTDLSDDTAVFTVTSVWEFEAGERVETTLSYTAQYKYGLWRFSKFPACPQVWSVQSDTAQSVEDSGDIALE